MPRSTIEPVGSNARCGSDVLRVNELSTTNVEPAARCELAASAAAAQASAVSATSGTINRHLWKVERLTVGLLRSIPGGLPDYATLGEPTRPGSGRGGSPGVCSQHADERRGVSSSSGGSSTGQRSKA